MHFNHNVISRWIFCWNELFVGLRNGFGSGNSSQSFHTYQILPLWFKVSLWRDSQTYNLTLSTVPCSEHQVLWRILKFKKHKQTNKLLKNVSKTSKNNHRQRNTRCMDFGDCMGLRDMLGFGWNICIVGELAIFLIGLVPTLILSFNNNNQKHQTKSFKSSQLNTTPVQKTGFSRY